MELSRFYNAIAEISVDYKSGDIEKYFTDLVNNLNNLAANPGNPEISQAFKKQLDDFRSNLEVSTLNDAEGDLLQIVDDLSLHDYVGNGLYTRIRAALDDNQLTPNLAANAITSIKNDTIEKLSHILSISKAFSELKIAYSKLENGQTEMLISLPIVQETKTLEDLSKETKEWHRICDAISETFDPLRTRITIRTVASGSVLLYLAAVPTFIYGVAKCLKGVNLILAEVIKMQSLYKQLSDSKAPTALLQDLETHNSNKAKTDLEVLANTLVDEYYKGNDTSRKNELTTSLSFALQRLSHKLATGAKVSLRLSPPIKPKIEEGVEATKEQEAIIKDIEFYKKIQIEVNSSNAALDYTKHATELIDALPAPIEDKPEKSVKNSK